MIFGNTQILQINGFCVGRFSALALWKPGAFHAYALRFDYGRPGGAASGNGG